MTRLPSQLQPLWPLAKKVHRWSSYGNGLVMRRAAPLQGERALPRRAAATPDETAVREPGSVTVHRVEQEPDGPRAIAPGTPERHWIFEKASHYEVPDRYAVEIADGIVVGDYGANITPGGTLDYETSHYFGIKRWREHPIYLRRRLPPVEKVDGTVVALATRGGSNNYYHFITDVLPRFGILEEAMPGVEPDGLYVPAASKWQQHLLELTGLSKYPVVPAGKHRAVRADRLIVPSIANPYEVAPRPTIEWLRRRLPPVDPARHPRRIYVTRGTARHTRSMVNEDTVWPMLEQRGFVKVAPETTSIQDQVDLFAAAEVIVAPHGAALTNLVFCSPGVRVLEMFAPSYVNAAYWAILQSIPDTHYRYLVAGDTSRYGPERYTRGRVMNDVMADVDLSAAQVADAVDLLLAD
jgi:capsular polysaccharide biosynthesis protein